MATWEESVSPTEAELGIGKGARLKVVGPTVLSTSACNAPMRKPGLRHTVGVTVGSINPKLALMAGDANSSQQDSDVGLPS